MEEKGIRLGRGGILMKKCGAGVITCHAGSLWITAAGHDDDILLRAGESYDARALRGVCVQAFEASILSLGGNIEEPAPAVCRPYPEAVRA